ncbi:MAG: hypothetical protein ACK2UC_07350 [Anaerolineae bacterium]
MKTIRWILVAFGLVIILAIAAVAVGFAVSRSVSLAQGLWDRPRDSVSAGEYPGTWGPGMMSGFWQGDGDTTSWRGPGMMRYGPGGDLGADTWHGPGMMGYGWGDNREGDTWPGPGTMGYDWDEMPFEEGMPCGAGYAVPGAGPVSSPEDVEAAVGAYVDRLGYDGLHVTEVMEFEYNYYAIVAEEKTGTGAMELLIDKETGAVGPEPGPNMMWNAEYGMHGTGTRGWGGMMGPGWGAVTASGEMSLSPAEAEGIAQDWLDANFPGRTAGEADPFYGYYTLHFLDAGEIEGMLSVHGATGEVWYHNWHGAFVQMVEEHD